MKNKKFLKALASFMLSGAAAVGCFAMFGCGHSHTYSSDWVNTDPDKHWHEATCEHKEERGDEDDHQYDANGKCTVCEYQKPQTPKHTHTPSEWKSDDDEHWKECTAPDCDDKGVKLEKAEHTLNSDETECIVCHKTFEVGGGEDDDPAAALATAKTNAKATLASYVNADDYTTNAEDLADAISAGNTAIDAATTTEGVATALANAKAAIDGIKSDATLAEEAAAAALAAAKTNAKATLASYVNADDYTTNATALAEAISAGNTAIDAATTTEGVTTALANAKAAIDDIKSDATLAEEAAAAALAAAKTNAKAQLANYVDADDYTQNATALAKAISDGNTAIDAATTTEGVTTALATAKAVIDDIKSDAELDEEADSHTVTFNMHNIGTAPAAQTVDKGGYATQPEPTPTATGYYFEGWYTDETYATEFDFENTAINKTTTVYACWSEDIVSTVTMPTVTSNTSITGSETIGKVTFVGGRWEANHIYNTGGGTPYIEFELTGSVNSVSFSSRGASSSGSVISFVKVENGTETAVETYASVANNVYLPGCDATNPLTISGLSAGTYRLKGSSSFRTNNISISERLVVSDPDSIIVTPSVVDFVIGDEFSSEGLQAVLHYKNGREDVLTNVSINSSAYNKNASGKYPVTVSYTLAGSTTPLTDTYYVYVYQVDSISLKTNATKQDANTPAGNQAYVNHSAQQVYFVGDKLNLDGYTVHLNSSVTVEGEAKKEKLFRYTPVAADFENFTTEQAGTVTVTLNAYGLTDEFEVIVMEKPVISDNMLNVMVSQKIGDAQKVGEVKTFFGLSENEEINSGDNVRGGYIFETIQQALDFLELLNLDDSVQKGIMLDAGEYKEKLEINIPNLTIMGMDTANFGGEGYDPAEVRKSVIIEWNSLYGVEDESGYTQTTDSTATLNVRAGAVGFQILNVTISNYFNCEENFYAEFGIGCGEHRALAMLIQADKVVIDNCELLGYQDTIQLFTGRQLIKNSYISGTTDFIFGSNNTTYFDNCEIHSIKRWKKELDANGNPVLETDGGYITAFKGFNKGDNDWVQYGAIFDNCTFTAEEGVAEGKTAIGRPWGKYAAVAVINSELGAHIATTSSGTASKNERYVTMSTVKPTESTVKFVEYNNTGDGAITGEVEGMSMLSATEAANYSNLSVIFGTTNGKVTYDDIWGGSVALVSVTITCGEKTATIYGYQGGTISKAKIDAAVAEVLEEGYIADTITYGDNQEFGADTVLPEDSELLQVTVTPKPADMTVTESVKYWFDSSNEGAETRTLAAGSTAIWGKLELDATEVTGPANGFAPNGTESYQWYTTNAGLTMSLKLKKGSAVEVRYYYEAGLSYKVDDGEATAFPADGEGDANNGNRTVTYTASDDCVLTIVCTAQNYIKYIDINVPVIYDTTQDINLLDIPKVESTTATYKGIEINANSGKFALNSTEDWIQFNAGTVLTFNVAEGAKVTVTEYPDNADKGYLDIKVVGTVATITALTNTYISTIHVECVPAGNVLSTLTVKASDVASATFTAASPVNWDTNGIIKLYSDTSKQWSIDASGKDIKDADGKVVVASGNRLKSNGAAPYITVDLSGYTGNYKITLSFAPSGTGDRTINFAEINASGEVVGSAIYSETTKDSNVRYQTCDISGGKVYKIYFADSAYNFYGIHISPAT